MKKKTHYLEIKLDEPCKESWTSMDSQNSGRYCHQCEKVVRDFSQATDAELIGFFREQPKNVCGRFRPTQLDRLYAFEPIVTTPHIGPWRSAALIGGLLFGGSTAVAQVMERLPPPIPEPTKIEVVDCFPGGLILEGKRTITGLVTSAKGEPLVGANIEMVGQTSGTVTDFDGYFEMTIPDELQQVAVNISFLGFEAQTITFDSEQLANKQPAQVILVEKSYVLNEVYVVAESQENHQMMLGGVSMVVHHRAPPEPEPIVEKVIDRTLTIAPNPFRVTFNIHFRAPANGRYQLELFDLSGKLLKHAALDLTEGEQQFPSGLKVDALPSSAYLLRILAPDGQHWIKTIMKVE